MELATMNRHWNDERIFQETRKIIGAQWAMVTYNEFLPIALGGNYMEKYKLNVAKSGFTKYDDKVDPTMTIEFSSGGFRGLGHSLIASGTKRLNDKYQSIDDTPLWDYWFYNPGFTDGYLDSYLRGMYTLPGKNRHLLRKTSS